MTTITVSWCMSSMRHTRACPACAYVRPARPSSASTHTRAPTLQRTLHRSPQAPSSNFRIMFPGSSSYDVSSLTDTHVYLRSRAHRNAYLYLTPRELAAHEYVVLKASKRYLALPADYEDVPPWWRRAGYTLTWHIAARLTLDEPYPARCAVKKHAKGGTATATT